MIDARKDIIFRDIDYKTKFKIKDGDSIKITVGYDGEELIRKCRFIDDHHIDVGSQCFHIDEFMEKMTRAGNSYEPIPDQEPKLNILVAEPGKPPQDAEIPMTHTALREMLGGEPEIISKDKFATVIQGANGNGTIVVCGSKGDILTSLHPYIAQSQKRELANRVPPTEDKKPATLAERLEVGKAKAAAHNSARQTNDTPQKKKDAAEH
jgi:hypothetical protein